MTDRKRFPLTAWQDFIISVESEIGTNAGFTSFSTISSAVHVRPAYSEPRIRRAFAALCRQHDILRCRFEEHQGRLWCTVQDRHPVGVTAHAYAAMDMPEIADLTHWHATRRITFADEALIRLDVLDFAEAGCVVMFRGHITLFDGFSLVSLVDTFIKTLLGLPLLRSSTRYQDYMASWGVDGEPLPPAVRDYWNAKLLPPPAPVNIGRVRRGMAKLSDARVWDRAKSLNLPVSRQQGEKAAKAAAAADVSLFALTNASFLQAVARDAGADDFLYGLTLGRSDAALSRYIGHHTLHPLMRCRGATDKPIERIARDASAELAEVSANLPAAAARVDGSWDRRLTDAGAYPRQILTGSNLASARISKSVFAGFLAHGAPKTQKVGPYEVTVMPRPPVAGDLSELTFRSNFDARGGLISIRYDAHAFDDDEIRTLAAQVFSGLGLDPEESTLVG